MTPQPGQQTIIIDILPINSRSKGNQAMKLGQVIVDNKIIIFHEKPCRNEPGKLDLSLFFKKLLYELNKVVCSLDSICFDSPQLGIQGKQTV